jgi:hypothetical protein
MEIKNKKGSEIHYIIISLILGLILIGIIFSWIYQEYFFGEEELDLQKCKESIFARSKIPNTILSEIPKVEDLKDKFPLQCKTRVITINDDNKDDAEKIISDAMAACWALYDNGNANIFPPNSKIENARTACFTCARIHFDTKINIYTEKMLDEKMGNEQTYLEYLTANHQNQYLIQKKSFDKEAFTIGDNTDVRNIFTYIADKITNDAATIYPPRRIDSEWGDLHITLSTWALREDLTQNQLLFYQNAEDNIKKLMNTEIQNNWFGGDNDIMQACMDWEGINV